MSVGITGDLPNRQVQIQQVWGGARVLLVPPGGLWTTYRQWPPRRPGHSEGEDDSGPNPKHGARDVSETLQSGNWPPNKLTQGQGNLTVPSPAHRLPTAPKPSRVLNKGRET